MKETKDVIQHIRAEANDYYSNDDLFSISSWGADLSFRELIDRYRDDELVKPELQRKYVWDKTEASRFIDSILLGLPVPSIFLAKTKDEKMLIIDGYQRIMTVYDFVVGIFSPDGKVFRLSRSEKINTRWKGKAFSELTDAEQRKIKNTTIHAIIFVQDHPSKDNTSLYQIFERINTSGITLLPQEIRNCVYQGSLNRLLLALNKHSNWRVLFGLEQEDARMRDVEFILRFFALSSDKFHKEKKEGISLKKFLNDFMRENLNPSEDDIEFLKLRFCRTIDFLSNTFGQVVFHNLSTTDPDRLVTKFNPTIFDSIMIATDYAITKSSEITTLKPIEATRRSLLSNKKYREALSKETMRTVSIRTRISIACNTLFNLTYE